MSNCYLPTEIVFLRTTVPAYGSYHSNSYDVKFDILEGNIENAFDILKRVENGVYVGKYILTIVALLCNTCQPMTSETGNCILFSKKEVAFRYGNSFSDNSNSHEYVEKGLNAQQYSIRNVQTP